MSEKKPEQILAALEQAGFEACYVGGCVRDLLLGRPVHDWDVTTSALPEETMACFPHCVPTGIRHGTVTVLEDGAKAEVTTFRCDGGYHDGRHPDQVTWHRIWPAGISRSTPWPWTCGERSQTCTAAGRTCRRESCAALENRSSGFRRTPCGCCGPCGSRPNWAFP